MALEAHWAREVLVYARRTSIRGRLTIMLHGAILVDYDYHKGRRMHLAGAGVGVALATVGHVNVKF